MIGVRDIGKVSCFALVLSSGAAMASMPGAQEVERSVAVSYAGLDLSKEAGVDELYARLQDAAEQVCRSGVHTQSSLLLRQNSATKRACYDEALSGAVARLDLPMLDEKHSG